jgi:hypothetical protein
MFKAVFLRRAILAAAVALLIHAQVFAADVVLYRIFLKDGSTLVSYGEFARVADRVVFSMPIGSLESQDPDLQLVSVADGSVDWARTEQYADAVRAKRYADTRGEEEFMRLSRDVARVLNDVALTPDPKRRLVIAEHARKVLSEWPSRNFGYRAKDVAQLSTLLDEVVSELRVAAGEPRLDLSLAIETMPPTPTELIAPPTFRETIEQAFTVARLTPESTERVSLLNSVVAALEPLQAESWAAALRARASADLNLELRTERAYSDLVARTMMLVDQRARVADVKGIERLVKDVLKADDRLGRRRPQATGALLATLDARLADARKLRLERDAFAARMNVITGYRRNIGKAIEHFRESSAGLEEIKALAGPSPKMLTEIAEHASRGIAILARMKAPADVHTVHGLLSSALQMAAQAAAMRQKAVQATSMDLAWQASSAAAGALMMFERANAELERLSSPPRL